MGSISQHALDFLHAPHQRDTHLISAARAMVLRTLLRVDSGIMPNEITVRLDTTLQKGADLDTVLGLERVHITLGKRANDYIEAFRKNLAAMTDVAVIHAHHNASELIFCGTLQQLATVDPTVLAARLRQSLRTSSVHSGAMR